MTDNVIPLFKLEQETWVLERDFVPVNEEHAKMLAYCIAMAASYAARAERIIRMIRTSNPCTDDYPPAA